MRSPHLQDAGLEIRDPSWWLIQLSFFFKLSKKGSPILRNTQLGSAICPEPTSPLGGPRNGTVKDRDRWGPAHRWQIAKGSRGPCGIAIELLHDPSHNDLLR